MTDLLSREPVPVTNMYCGVATLSGGTVSVAFKDIEADSIVLLTPSDTNNAGTMSYVITAGTGFAINSSNGADTGNVSWLVILNT